MTLEFPYEIKEKLEKIGNKMSDSITNNLDWYLKYAEEEIIPKKRFLIIKTQVLQKKNMIL